MKEKNITKEKIILYSLLAVLVLCGLFYLLFLRPLLAEQALKNEQLHQVEAAASDYKKLLAELEQEPLAGTEKDRLTAALPARANVEQFIQDLSATEAKTGALIDQIAVGLAEEKQDKTETADEAENEQWRTLFPEKVYTELEEELEAVQHITISPLDVEIELHGEEQALYAFVERLEQLPRIVHVQSYYFTRQEEEAGMLEGSVTARIFYGEGFQQSETASQPDQKQAKQ